MHILGSFVVFMIFMSSRVRFVRLTSGSLFFFCHLRRITTCTYDVHRTVPLSFQSCMSLAFWEYEQPLSACNRGPKVSRSTKVHPSLKASSLCSAHTDGFSTDLHPYQPAANFLGKGVTLLSCRRDSFRVALIQGVRCKFFACFLQSNCDQAVSYSV